MNATTAKEVKERWYDTRYYPIYHGNEEWQKHSMFDTLDILNPPLDLLAEEDEGNNILLSGDDV